jgi:hypothetical protein
MGTDLTETTKTYSPHRCAEQRQLIFNWQRQGREPCSYFRCQPKKHRSPCAPPHNRARKQSVFSSVKSVQSVFPKLSMLVSCALAQNRNSRSGWHREDQPLGNADTNGLNELNGDDKALRFPSSSRGSKDTRSLTGNGRDVGALHCSWFSCRRKTWRSPRLLSFGPVGPIPVFVLGAVKMTFHVSRSSSYVPSSHNRTRTLAPTRA